MPENYLNPPDIEDDGSVSNEELEALRARNVERAYDEWRERDMSERSE